MKMFKIPFYINQVNSDGFNLSPDPRDQLWTQYTCTKSHTGLGRDN